MRVFRRIWIPAFLVACVVHVAAAQDIESLLQRFNDAYAAAVAADEAKDLEKALPHWREAFSAIDQFEETEEIVPFKETVLFKLGETERLLAKAARDGAQRDAHFQAAEGYFDALLERAVLAVYSRDDILLQQGYLYSDQGQYLAAKGALPLARDAQQKALDIFQGLDNVQRRDDVMARERSALAKTLKDLGQYQEALRTLALAVQYWGQAAQPDELRRERNALATVKLAMGRIADAATDFQELLDENPEARDLTRASAAFNLGICMQLLGEYQRARQQFTLAGDLARELGDEALRLQIVNSTGILAFTLGLYKDALDMFGQAAAGPDSQLRAKALLNAVAVRIASLQENYESAVFDIALQDAVESVSIAASMDDARTQLAATENMGRLYYEKAVARDVGQEEDPGAVRAKAYADALEYLGKALGIADNLARRGAAAYEYSDVASNIGDVLLSLSQADLNGLVNTSGLCPDGSLLDCSLAHFRLAQQNAENIQAMEQLWQAHLGQGRAQRLLGDIQEAAAQYKAAIEIIEAMRNVLGADQAVGFLRDRAAPYTEYVDLLLEQWSQAPQGSPQAQELSRNALEYLERSRQAAVKALFEQALPAERREQGRELAQTAYQLARLRLHPQENQDSIQELETRRNALELALQEGDPFLHKPALDIDEVRHRMPPDFAVLVFYYNERKMYVWKLTAHGLGLYGADRIQRRGRLRRDFVETWVAPFGEKIAAFESTNTLYECYNKLFKDTGLPLSPDQEPRLAVIPYGALSVLPFGALLVQKDPLHYLLEDYEVGYLYSLSQLVLEHPGRTQSLLAVGNPRLPGYFGKELRAEPQERSRDGQTQEEVRGGAMLGAQLPYEEAAFIYRMLNPEDYAPTVRAVDTRRAFSFAELPDAGKEARVIGQEYEESGQGTARAVSDEPLTESELLRALGETPHRYVHLATHGKLLPASPLDSFLVFSEDPQAPQGYKSGLVTVRQIRGDLFGKLPGTRLATLSCCETALRGQGLGLELASLAGAFQSAGAAVVVASLWEVPSKATARLMESFYNNLFAGKMIPQALRLAQLDMLADKATADPLYWAAFIPIGADFPDQTPLAATGEPAQQTAPDAAQASGVEKTE